MPKLRFPEFKGTEAWEERTLGQVAEYENGKAHENDVSERGRFIIVNSKFISTDGVVRKYTDSGHCLADKDDILMVMSDVPNGKAIAKCYLVTVDNLYTINQRICRLKPYKNINSRYISYVIDRNKFYLNFDDGVKQTNLRKEDVLNCPINIPSPNEQQKIADCLSSLDDLITAHTKKLDNLKTHKKGLMQQLFPAEGETVPKLRFPEFREEGEWESTTLGKIASLHKGKGISKAEIDDTGKSFCIRYGELYTKYKEAIFTVYSKTTTPTNELVLSKKNDVLIPSSGETKIDIATASCVMQDGIAIGGDINVIRSNQNGVFLSYYLNSAKKLDIAKLAQGDAVVHLYISQLELLNVVIPTLIEQQKIADCLLSLDNLITVQIQKIEALKLHKKGLMQQLFPTTDEVDSE